MSKAKEEVEENETIAIHAISSMSQTGLQKMATAIFHGTNNFVTMYVPYDKTKKEQKERTLIGFLVSGKKTYREILDQCKEILEKTHLTRSSKLYVVRKMGNC